MMLALLVRLARLRWLVVLAVACRGAGSPAPAPSLASAPAAPAAVPTTSRRAPGAPPAPTVRYRVAIVPFATPHGDINAPSYAARLAKLLREVAAAKDTVVALPDRLDGCEADLGACAVAIGGRARVDIVIYGILEHGTEEGRTTLWLESVALASGAVRKWEDSITMESDTFFKHAMQSAHKALVEQSGNGSTP
jgi:hypothetical protein